MNYAFLIFCMVISVLLSIGLPIALPIIWRKKTHARLLPAAVGAAIFILFVLVLERLLHSVVLKQPAIIGNTVLYVLYAGFAAGIFEETGRWFAFRFLLKKYREREAAITYGIGHGGIEAILITGISMAANLALVVILALNGEAGLSAIVGSEETATLVSTYQSTAPVLFLVGGLERVTAMALHIALSILVFRAVREHKAGYWLLAILFHALVDCFAVLYSVGVIANIWVIELGVLVMTAGIALLALRAYRAMGENLSPEDGEPIYGPEESILPEENERTYEPEELFPTGEQSAGPEELFPTEEAPLLEEEEYSPEKAEQNTPQKEP